MTKLADVQSVFGRKIKELTERKDYIIGRFVSWEQERIEEIKKYATEQKTILDKRFEDYKHDLENECKNKIAAGKDLEKTNDNEQLERLLAECHVLKRNLLMISKQDRTVSYLEILLETPSEQKNSGGDDHRSRRSSIQPQAVQSNDPDIANEMLEKCPLCFMIFSKAMSKNDRSVHINEHYSD